MEILFQLLQLSKKVFLSVVSANVLPYFLELTMSVSYAFVLIIENFCKFTQPRGENVNNDNGGKYILHGNG